MENKLVRPPNFDPLRFSPPPKRTETRISEEARAELIARAAYFRAERRGFEPGHEIEDWLAAEAEVDQQIAEARLRERLQEW